MDRKERLVLLTKAHYAESRVKRATRTRMSVYNPKQYMRLLREEREARANLRRWDLQNDKVRLALHMLKHTRIESEDEKGE
jgi:hypothetical protein